DGLAREGVGKVLILLHDLGPAIDRLSLAGEVRVRPGQEPKELVKPPPLRVELGGRPQVPLADEPGGVAGSLQAIGDGRLRQRQPEPVVARALPRIELVAESLLIPPGQQARARGAAIGAGYVAVRAADAAPRDRVDPRGRYVLAAVETDVSV